MKPPQSVMLIWLGFLLLSELPQTVLFFKHIYSLTKHSIMYKLFMILFLFGFISSCSDADVITLEDTNLSEQHNPPDIIPFRKIVDMESAAMTATDQIVEQKVFDQVLTLHSLPPMEPDSWLNGEIRNKTENNEKQPSYFVTVNLPMIGIVMIPYSTGHLG